MSKPIQSSWLWDISIVAMGYGWVLGIALANCSCAGGRSPLDAPPDSAPPLRAPCIEQGAACDLPGDCCRGLACVGPGVCAPIGELVWRPPLPCVVLVDRSDSMIFSGYSDAVDIAVQRSTPDVVVDYAAGIINEPTWAVVAMQCPDAHRVVVVTDEPAQGGAPDDTQTACLGVPVTVMGLRFARDSWPRGVTWRELTLEPDEIAAQLRTACR